MQVYNREKRRATLADLIDYGLKRVRLIGPLIHAVDKLTGLYGQLYQDTTIKFRKMMLEDTLIMDEHALDDLSENPDTDTGSLTVLDLLKDTGYQTKLIAGKTVVCAD